MSWVSWKALYKVCSCSSLLCFDLDGRLDLTQALHVGFIYTPTRIVGARLQRLFQSMKSHRYRFNNVLRSALVKE